MFALFLMSLSVSAVTNITACTTIGYSGEYALSNNIATTSPVNCLIINANDVYLNLQEHLISGGSSSYSTLHAIHIANGVINVTIENGSLAARRNLLSLAGNNSKIILRNITHKYSVSYATPYLIGMASNTEILVNQFISDPKSGYSSYAGVAALFNSEITDSGTGNNRTYSFINSYLYDVAIVRNNSLFSSASYTLNNYFQRETALSLNAIGNLNNSAKGNYYTNIGATEYSDICVDFDSNGICDTPLNLSLTFDYFPIRNQSLLLYLINETDFAVISTTPLLILSVSSNVSDYFNPLRCSDPSNSDYLLCDNFEYAGELSTNGWTYSDNNVWSNTSNLTYYPSTIVAYQGNSFKSNSSKGGIYHTFFASPDSSATIGTEEIYEGGVLVKTVTYSNPKLNVKKIKTSFYLKTNYTPGLTDGSGTFWGINENPITNDTSVDSNLYMYLDHTKNYIYYTAEVNSTKTLMFYTYNFTSDSYYAWLSINPAPTTSVKVENTLFFENDTCWNYDTIYVGGTSYTSALRHAGYSRGDVSIYGEYLLDSPCSSFKSIYFRTTGQNNSNPGIFLIDQLEVLITESTSNLNLRVFDCTSQDSFITLCDDYWMTNNCVNVSTSNVLPIAATVIVNNEIYTASSQGYVKINGISVGTYSVNITYGNVSNYIIVATNNTNVYRDVCFFSSGIATIPPGTSEFADKIIAFFAKYGVVSSSSKLLIAVIIMIIGTLIIVFSLPEISFVIAILFNILAVIAFTALGFIPIWAIVLIVVFALALILPKLIGGQG